MEPSRRTSARLAGTRVQDGSTSPSVLTPQQTVKKATLTRSPKTVPAVPRSDITVRGLHSETNAVGEDLEEKIEVKDADGKTVKKRKVKKEIDLSTFDYPARFFDSNKYVGAHVSISGGIHHAVHNALQIGARAFALFTKNQRQWAGPPLDAQNVESFTLGCTGKVPRPTDTNAEVDASEHVQTLGDGVGFNRKLHILPHGSYLVNLANPDPSKWAKSFECFIDELQRAEKLGVGLFNFHPGSSTGGCTKEEAIKLIATGINQAHKLTTFIVILLENMAGKGNIIGGNFSDLAHVIDLVEDKTRVGVCLDTCHAFAAGYDLRTPEAYDITMKLFEGTVGFKYLKALHFNDSKGEFESHRDLHENIGMGNLGLMAFACLMSDPRLDELPLILETPMLDQTLNASGPGGRVWQNECNLLYRLEKIGPNEKLIETDEIVQKLFGEIQEAVLESRRVKEQKKLAAKKAKKNVDEDEEIDDED